MSALPGRADGRALGQRAFKSDRSRPYCDPRAEIHSSINALLDARLRGHDTGPAWADCELLWQHAVGLADVAFARRD